MTILKPMTQSCNDTFVSLQSSDDPEVLLDHLNNQHPRMKFTTETELDGHIPFLDVQVTKTEDGLGTSVYRKPTHSDKYVHFNSNHPPQVKTGIISTLCRRAQNISKTQTEERKKIDHINDVFTNYNNYPHHLVNRTIQRALRKTDNTDNQETVTEPPLPSKYHTLVKPAILHHAYLKRKPAST